MTQDILKTFQEAYRNLELLPLSQQKALDNFRVDYGGEVIEELEQLVKIALMAMAKLFLQDIEVVVSLHY
jgi:hypothetical protein